MIEVFCLPWEANHSLSKRMSECVKEPQFTQFHNWLWNLYLASTCEITAVKVELQALMLGSRGGGQVPFTESFLISLTYILCSKYATVSGDKHQTRWAALYTAPCDRLLRYEYTVNHVFGFDFCLNLVYGLAPRRDLLPTSSCCTTHNWSYFERRLQTLDQL